MAIEIYTDGSCIPNPGRGGWAAIIVRDGAKTSVSGYERDTTNNRMELTAVIRGLQSLKRPTQVELFTDSVYVGKGLQQWLPKWKANGWRRKEGKRWVPIKNEDLWRLLDEMALRHRITYTRVAGHSGHPENERCDEMAVEAYQRFL